MTSKSPASPLERVTESFSRQSLMRTAGARIDSVSEGLCRIAAPIGSGMRQQHGAAHAGLTFALGDTAAGYSALTVMPEGREVMTVEMKINLMAPAVGDRLVATGEVVRAGRRLVVVRAEVVAERDEGPVTVAILQGTMIPVDPA